MIHNKNISYLRIRPCDSDNEIYLNSRAKEGTSSFTLKSDLLIDYKSLLIKGFQTISSDVSCNSSAWFISDANINTEITHNSKRLIYRYKDNRENALEIISRYKPSVVLIENLEDVDFFLSLNGITKFKISKYTNSIDEAIEAISKGVDDLFLRDWSRDQIQELQSKIQISMHERTLLSPLLTVNEARNILSKIEFTNFLQTRNVRGYKREMTTWFPGSGEPIPNLFNFTSETLSDYKTKNFDNILDKFEKTKNLTEVELLELFKTSGKYINKIAELANDCLLYTSPSPRDS